MNKEQYKNLITLYNKYHKVYDNTIFYKVPPYKHETGWEITEEYIQQSVIIGNYIYESQQKCNHNYTFYKDLKETAAYKVYFKDIFNYGDEYECQNCWKIRIFCRKSDTLPKTYTTFGSYGYAWQLAITDHYIQIGSKMESSLPYELTRYGFSQDYI